MTVPLILLATHCGLVLVALAISSFGAHLHAVAEHVRRVSAAVERAATSQLLSPLKWALAGSGVLSLGGAVIGARSSVPVWWSILLPPIVACISAASLFVGARTIHRVLSRSAASPAPGFAHCAREGSAAVLLTGATTIAVSLGIQILAESALDAKRAHFLGLLSCASAAWVHVLFARAATSAILTSQAGASSEAADPHGASLAVLVSESFHFPLLLLGIWSTLTLVAHSVLSLEDGSTSSPNLLLYSRLLQLLGLFALGFGAWAARIQDGEPSRVGWLRATIVTSVLLIAGTWSFASQLPSLVAWSVPGIVSGFFVLLLSFARRRYLDPPAGLAARTSHLVRIVTFVSLLCLLLAGIARLDFLGASQLQLAMVLSAGVHAVLPLATLQALATSFEATRSRVQRLAFIGEPSVARVNYDDPSSRVLPTLGLLAAITCCQLDVVQGSMSLNLGLGLVWGMSLGALSSHLIEVNCALFQPRVVALLQTGTEDDLALDLEAANKICEDTIASRTWLWALALLLPGAGVLLLQLLSTVSAGSKWGAIMGLCLYGAGHWCRQMTGDNRRIALGMMSFATSLAQLLIILFLTSSF